MNKQVDPLTAQLADLTQEVEAIKRLLMVLLVKLGASTEELGVGLGTTASTVRNTFSVRKVRRLDLGQSSEAER